MHVEPTDSFQTIKHKASELFNRNPSDVKLFQDERGEHELVDAATIADKEIVHDAIIYLVLTKQGNILFQL
jgi:hypothetical protein